MTSTHEQHWISDVLMLFTFQIASLLYTFVFTWMRNYNSISYSPAIVMKPVGMRFCCRIVTRDAGW
jgi:hypothetical protein